MQKTAGQEALVHVDGQKRQDDNPYSILKNGNRQNGQHQDQLLPIVAQKKVGGQDAGDDQGHSGADAAALLGHLDGDLSHLENELFSIVGDSEQAKDHCRCLR